MTGKEMIMMKKLAILVGLIAAAWSLATVPALAAPIDAGHACAPEGKVRYVCGADNVEDLVQVPGTRWILASGMTGPADPVGHLYLIDSVRKTATAVTPDVRGPALRPYAACPGPIDLGKIAPHGVAIRPGAKGRSTLYVVNHGGRQSIEMFEVNAAGAARPTLRWIGCAVLPDGVSGNAVAPLPGGGFVATKFQQADDPQAFAKMASGLSGGSLYAWTPKHGYSLIPASSMIAANGVELSRDGHWIVANDWPARRVYRFRRGSSAKPASVAMPGFLPDNVRMGPDGRILITGQDGDIRTLLACDKPHCAHDWTVVSLDPVTLKLSPVAHIKGTEAFSDATVGLRVGRDLWVGTYRGDRVAILRAP